MKKRKSAGAREWVDPDDAPELTQEWFERADLYHGDRLVKAGKGGPDPQLAEAIRRTRGRPPSPNPKLAVNLRLDADVVERLRATGAGWQTRINETLRRAVARTKGDTVFAGRKLAAKSARAHAHGASAKARKKK